MVIDIPQRLKAAGVTLRPIRTADTEPYAQAFVDDPNLGRLLGMERDPTSESLRERLANAHERAAQGKGVELAIERKGGFAGSVLAHSFDWTHRRCEIGFWLVPGARHHGLGGAAVARLLDWVFAELPIDRVEMTTTSDNAATRAFARRMGFLEEGVWRQRNVERGRRVDLAQFGLLREEWPPPPPSPLPSPRPPTPS
ncbi:MAG: GNAT family N-acetyltransferase [Solirubrobacteraceae bacterium]